MPRHFCGFAMHKGALAHLQTLTIISKRFAYQKPVQVHPAPVAKNVCFFQNSFDWNTVRGEIQRTANIQTLFEDNISPQWIFHLNYKAYEFIELNLEFQFSNDCQIS